MTNELWRGIGKLTEESGEVLQLAGKIIAFPSGPHPDGAGDLGARIRDELADLLAAIDYFSNKNFSRKEVQQMLSRRKKKLRQFHEWELSGIAPETS